ncbi:MAG: DDE-type integrase/transposase/recombinase [Capsulimonadaceae bacterium]|nr:DDE-type integrase/transposase/recombinase [Capsulimonadaceae bacterium]
MNTLKSERRTAVIRCLVEGNSIRSTVRITGVAKNTVVKLLVDLGGACERYQDGVLRNLACERVQCDEIWSFVGCKDKNVPDERRGELGIGDVWTWTAIDADTKIVLSWLVSTRDADAAFEFMQDVADRLTNRVQLTTDAHKPYLNAVKGAFGNNIDYAMLVKEYGSDPLSEKRYSPAVCLSASKRPKIGKPDSDFISTSINERHNLTMRMSMRRFTRLTNAFSKKVENHAAAISLHFMYYNFVRIHQTIKTTPAFAAGVTDKIWTLEDVVALLNSN